MTTETPSWSRLVLIIISVRQCQALDMHIVAERRSHGPAILAQFLVGQLIRWDALFMGEIWQMRVGLRVVWGLVGGKPQDRCAPAC
jgi:hypothetical protein